MTLAGRPGLTEGDRAMSTNHLMGRGYWVWLIRLASRRHPASGSSPIPPSTISTSSAPSPKATAWLRAHEPQCAAVLAEHADRIRDFRVMKNYSHGATKVFDGHERWCHRRFRDLPGSAVFVGSRPRRDR